MSLANPSLASKRKTFAGLNASSPSIQIQNIHDIDSFEALRSDWDILLEQSPNQDAFLTWEWLFSWLKHHSADVELWLVTAWIQDELVGICPLTLKKVERHGLKFRLLRSLGAPHADIGGFIVKNNSIEVYTALCKYLVAQKRYWDLLELEEIDIVRGKVSLITSILNQSGCATLETRNRHFYLDTIGDWNCYFRQLPSKVRHEFRRKAKHVEITACSNFIHHSGADVTCEDVNTMFAINEHGHFPEFFGSAEEKDFHHELLGHMSARNSIDISFLYFDDKPAAFSYGFIHNDRLEVWRIGFDRAYSDLSVGVVLMNKLLESCFAGNYKQLDFLRGEEPYKEQWQPQYRTYSQIRAVPHSKLVSAIISIWSPKLTRFLQSLKKK